MISSLLNKFFILLIDFYRYFISPIKPASCRFYPSCSLYSRQSLIEHGIVKGLYFSLLRIVKCHPFHPGGFDPVPYQKIRKKNNGQ